MVSWLALILSIGTLFFIAIEDIKYRAVTWWLFLLLFVSGIAWARQFKGWEDWFFYFLINLAFLLLQLLLLSLYFTFKNRQIVNITSSLIGIGDILFMVCSCCFFSLPVFMIFHIGSLLASLILAICFAGLKKKGIPLAGLQSIVLISFLLIQSIWQFNPFDDSSILLLISSQIP